LTRYGGKLEGGKKGLPTRDEKKGSKCGGEVKAHGGPVQSKGNRVCKDAIDRRVDKLAEKARKSPAEEWPAAENA